MVLKLMRAELKTSLELVRHPDALLTEQKPDCAGERFNEIISSDIEDAYLIHTAILSLQRGKNGDRLYGITYT